MILGAAFFCGEIASFLAMTRKKTVIAKPIDSGNLPVGHQIVSQ